MYGRRRKVHHSSHWWQPRESLPVPMVVCADVQCGHHSWHICPHNPWGRVLAVPAYQFLTLVCNTLPRVIMIYILIILQFVDKPADWPKHSWLSQPWPGQPPPHSITHRSRSRSQRSERCENSWFKSLSSLSANMNIIKRLMVNYDTPRQGRSGAGMRRSAVLANIFESEQHSGKCC